MKVLATLAFGLALLSAAPAPALPPVGLRVDLALLRTAFSEAYPSDQRYANEASVEAAYARAEAALDRPMDSRAFFVVVSTVLATYRDGHIAVDLSEADEAAFRANTPILPIRVIVRDGHIYVLRDLSGRSRSIAGAEILSINGYAAHDILARLAAGMPNDGSIMTSVEWSLSRGLRFNRLFALLIDPSDTFEVRVRSGFRRRTHSLDGASLESLEQSWRAAHPDDFADRDLPWADVAFVENGQIALLTVRGFDAHADLEEQERMDAFFARTFNEIKMRNARALIVDVRDNGGGRDEQGRQLYAYLAQRPFAYYDGLYLQSPHFSFSEHATPPVEGPPPQIYETDSQGRLRMRQNSNYGTHQPEANAFVGPAFVLMNGGSFSTTAEFLSIVHANRRATLIGEEAGGGYYGPTGGATLMLTLPHSGLRIRMPLQRYELAVSGFSPTDRGVPADIVIRPSIQDRLANRDPVMERALQLARESRHL